jgi:WASH complex subunit 7
VKIETSLRLSVHTKTANPKLLGEDELKLMRPFLDIHPLKIVNASLDVRHEVTHYLNLTFYNLTTVALHDWRTYADMRSLAQEKLGVSLMETFLPMGSLADQALDVLQIMRNIHIFVTRFKYDLTMQQFIEFRPENSSKHLNTIKIQNITASIRQHGLGILNTTVNYTYQFLTQKFNIFSEFLFDDTIRSYLSREYNWYKKNRNNKEVNNVYPHERAVKLLRDIKKLGASEGGKSFLDLFRILITEIGNALGYVRMVRSASMNSCSEAVKFIPDLENIVEYERLVGSKEPAEEDPNDIYAQVR